MNKRGSATVEAAMVFPVIILSIMSAVCILIYFYNQISEQVDIHMDLRSECGEMCDNMYYDNQGAKRSVYRDNDLIYSYGTVKSGEGKLLKGRESRIYAEKYLIDETAVVRIADLLATGDGSDEQ